MRIFITSCFVCAAFQAAALDWPQWQGPDRDSISRETGLLDRWPSGGPPLAWLGRDIGLGYSGPAVVGNRLFIMGTRGGEEFLFCVDALTGKELWATAVGELLTNNWGDGPRGTPTVDGNRVYAMSAKGALISAGLSDGRIHWKKKMTDLGGKRPGWGYTESVLVDGDKVICTPGGGKGTLAALDKLTGKLLWQSSQWTDGAQYASVMAGNHQGARQYIQLTKKNLAGVSAKNGRVLWKSEWPGRTAVIPTPIYTEGRVYISSGYGVGCRLIAIGKDNKVREIYSNRNMKNQHGGVLLHEGHLYGYSDGHGWVCQDLESGDIVWSDKQSLGKGCVSMADGKLYCVSERKGVVALVDASPKGWTERGRFTLTPQTERRKPAGKIWVHPVVANGRLYLRDQELLFCYNVKGK